MKCFLGVVLTGRLPSNGVVNNFRRIRVRIPLLPCTCRKVRREAPAPYRKGTSFFRTVKGRRLTPCRYSSCSCCTVDVATGFRSRLLRCECILAPLFFGGRTGDAASPDIVSRELKWASALDSCTLHRF